MPIDPQMKRDIRRQMWATARRWFTIISFLFCTFIIAKLLVDNHTANSQLDYCTQDNKIMTNNSEMLRDTSAFYAWISCVESGTHIVNLSKDSRNGIFIDNTNDAVESLIISHCNEEHQWDPQKINKWLPGVFG